MTTTTQPWLRAELIAGPETTPGAQLMIPADGVEFHDDQLVFHHQGEIVYVADQGQLRSITWFAKQPNPETARRKAIWPNHGTRWTDAQRADLLHRLQQGQPWPTISTAAGRSRTGCQQEAIKQGWLDPDTLRPRPALFAATPYGTPPDTAAPQAAPPNATSSDAPAHAAPPSAVPSDAAASPHVAATHAVPPSAAASPQAASPDTAAPRAAASSEIAAPRAAASASSAAPPTIATSAAAPPNTTGSSAALPTDATSATARPTDAASATARPNAAVSATAPPNFAASATARPNATIPSAPPDPTPGIHPAAAPELTAASTAAESPPTSTSNASTGSSASVYHLDPGASNEAEVTSDAPNSAAPHTATQAAEVSPSEALAALLQGADTATPASSLYLGTTPSTADPVSPTPAMARQDSDGDSAPPQPETPPSGPNSPPPRIPRQRTDPDADPAPSSGNRFLSRAQSSLARATLNAYMNPSKSQT